MHYKLLLLLSLSTGCFANDSSFRQSVLSGYSERCQEVMSQTETNIEKVKSVCSCEVNVIDSDFSTFSFLIFGVNKSLGIQPMPEEKTIALKNKLKKCKE